MDEQVRVELFAGLRLFVGVKELPPLRSQKAASLLAFLAFHVDRNHSREILVEMLWPDAEPEAGRNRLNVCVSQIRALLKSQPPADLILQSDRLRIWLDRSRLTTDVSDFERHLAADASTNDPTRIDHLASAIDLYRGPLLPGFYEEWVSAQQERMRELVNRASAELVRLLTEARSFDRAIEYARRTVAAEPLLESAHRDLMRLLAAAGRPAEAVKQYRALERRLREDLGVAPAEETSRLLGGICKEPEPFGTRAQGAKRRAQDSAENDHRDELVSQARDAEVVLPSPSRTLSRPSILKRSSAGAAATVAIVLLGLYCAQLLRTTGRAPANPAVPTPRLLWTATYTPATDEKDSESRAITSDADGNIYIAGLVQTSGHDVDILTMKYGSNGKLVWKKRWNNPKTNDCDRGRFIAVDRWGNVWVTGETYNGDRAKGGTQWDVVTLKYDVNGDLKWARLYNSSPNDDDTPAGLGRDAEDNVYVAGTAKGPDGSEHFFLLKYDTNGKPIWTEEPGPTIESLPISDLAVRSFAEDATGTGGLFLTGSATFQDSPTQRTRDLFTLRYNRDRHRQWQSRFTSKSLIATEGRVIAVDSELYTYVASAYSLPNGNEAGENMVVVKYDPSGNELWSTPCSKEAMGASVTPRDLKVDMAGNVFALATASYASHAFQQSGLFVFGPTGRLLWSDRSDKLEAVSVEPCGDGSAAYWGSYDGGGPLDLPDRFQMVWLDARGDRRATHELNAVPGHYVRANVLHQDSFRNLICAGQTWSGKQLSIALYKYSP